MATQQNEEEHAKTAAVDGLSGWFKDRYQHTREHFEIYGHVWASYILMFGSLGTMFAVKLKKARIAEDKMRAAQEVRRQLFEAKQLSLLKKSPSSLASSSTSPVENNVPSSTNPHQ